MKTMLTMLSIITILAIGAGGERQNCTPIDQQKWIQSALKEIQTIKIGSTRTDLMKVFTATSGFFMSTKLSGTYTYIDCPYIRVDVEFSPAPTGDTSAESSKDVIRTISKPYLAVPQYD